MTETDPPPSAFDRGPGGASGPDLAAPLPPPTAQEIAEVRARAEIAAWFDRVEALVPRPALGRAAAIANIALFLALTTAAVGLSPFDAHAWLARAVQPAYGDLLRWGANLAPLTLHGEPWRLLASAFLHGGILHVAVNAYGLWQMGWVERTLGRAGFVVVYLAAAIAGSLASLLNPAPTASVGASGALCGLIGAIFGTVLVPSRSGVPRVISGRLMRSLLTIIALNAILGATYPMIDNRAHVGGFVAGLVISLAIVRPPTPEAAAGRVRRAVIAAAVSAALLTAGYLALTASPFARADEEAAAPRDRVGAAEGARLR